MAFHSLSQLLYNTFTINDSILALTLNRSTALLLARSKQNSATIAHRHGYYLITWLRASRRLPKIVFVYVKQKIWSKRLKGHSIWIEDVIFHSTVVRYTSPVDITTKGEILFDYIYAENIVRNQFAINRHISHISNTFK